MPQDLRMNSDYQHFLVIGTIKDSDPPAFGKSARRAPEKIMFQFLSARLFEAEDLTAFQINPGHDVPDGTVLTGRIHSLKDQQQSVAVGCIVKVLQRAQLSNMLFQ